MSAAPVLRPLSVADMVDEIFRLYRREFALLFSIAALLSFPSAILLAFGTASLGALSPRRPFSAPILADAITALGLGLAVTLLLAPLLYAAVTDATAKRYLGRPTTANDSIRRGFHTYWRSLLGIILTAVITVAVAAGVGVLGPLAIGVLVVAVGENLLGILLAFLLGLVWIVVWMAAVVWIVATFALYVQAVVVEDVGVIAGLRRSAHLVHRARWRLIGIMLLLVLVQAVVVSLPLGFVNSIVIMLPLPTQVQLAVTGVVSALAQAVYYPVQLGTLTLLYFDLRVRKEAMDLTLAAERLPSA